MVCRNKGKAEEARSEIVRESGNTVSPRVVRLQHASHAMGRRKPRVCETDAFLVILGGLRPHRGHVGDARRLGVCGGLQESVPSLECVGVCQRSPFNLHPKSVFLNRYLRCYVIRPSRCHLFRDR